LPGYPLDAGFDDSAAPQDNGAENYAAEPPYPEEPAYPPYPEQPGPYAPSQHAINLPVPAPASEEGVTLIFKDGRPPQQIHNFLLTRTTLYVGDRDHRTIPTDQLDLVATAKANPDAAVEFQLPGTPR
jgi:hypothetical protein